MKRFALGPLSVDTDHKILINGTERVHLAHKPTSILLLLLENAGHVVDRATLRKTFWPGMLVEEAVITRNISLIRNLLKKCLNGVDCIETISKTGYRFAVKPEVSNLARR